MTVFLSKRLRSRKTADSWSEKVRYVIHAPSYFADGKAVGETIADDPEKLIGRILQVPLSDINDDYSRMHVILLFQIIGTRGYAAHTRFRGHSYARDFLRYLVRRRATRIDAIFNTKSQDEIPLRITATAFTTHRAKTSQKEGIRTIMREMIEETASETSFAELVTITTNGELAESINRTASKIFPLKAIEIQKSKVLVPVEEQTLPELTE